MTTDYQPIACSLHDRYEIAIMHKKPVSLEWTADDGVHRETVMLKDIVVRNREEFLLVKTQDNEEHCIRLDKVSLLG